MRTRDQMLLENLYVREVLIEKSVSLNQNDLNEIKSYFEDFEKKLISKAEARLFGSYEVAKWSEEEFNKLNSRLSKYNIVIDDAKGERVVTVPFYVDGNIYLPNDIIDRLGLYDGALNQIMTVIGHEIVHKNQDIKSKGKMGQNNIKYMTSHPLTKNRKGMEDVPPEHKEEVRTHSLNKKDEVTAQAYSYVQAFKDQQRLPLFSGDIKKEPKLHPYNSLYKKLSPENKKRFMRIAWEYYQE